MLAAIEFSARATAATLPFERDLAMVAGPFNFVTFVSVLIPGYSLVTREHGLGYISKLRSMPSFVDGWIDGLRDGARAGRVATARGVAAAVDAFDALLRRDVTDDPLASQEPPSELNPADAAAWRNDVVSAIRDAASAVASSQLTSANSSRSSPKACRARERSDPVSKRARLRRTSTSVMQLVTRTRSAPSNRCATAESGSMT